jgi:hypothetical protein
MPRPGKQSSKKPQRSTTKKPAKSSPPKKPAAPPTVHALAAANLSAGSPVIGGAKLREISDHVVIMFQGWDHLRELYKPGYPKIDELKAWYMKQRLPNGKGISKNLAEAMATIVRPSKLTEGGRPGYRKSKAKE